MFGDLNLAGQNMSQLSDAEKEARKKKLMAGGQSTDFASMMSQLFGNRNQQTGSQGA